MVNDKIDSRKQSYPKWLIELVLTLKKERNEDAG
jgi:hypothetical protein